MFFCDFASRSNTALDSVSSTLRYCTTAPRANLEIVRLVARIRRLSSQRLCKNKIFGKVSATPLFVSTSGESLFGGRAASFNLFKCTIFVFVESNCISAFVSPRSCKILYGPV